MSEMKLCLGEPQVTHTLTHIHTAAQHTTHSRKEHASFILPTTTKTTTKITIHMLHILKSNYKSQNLNNFH